MSTDTENHVNGEAKPPFNVLQSRRRIWLFSMPRTASNLFVKMMGGHSGIANVEYEFMYGAFFKTMNKFDLGALSEDEKAWVRQTYDEAFKTVVTKVEAAENEGKTVFAKEHSLMVLDRELASTRIYRPEEPLSGLIQRDQWTMHMPGESETRRRTNVSMFPDEFLRSWLPVFLIRHPALMIPSQYRVFKKTVAADPLETETMALSGTYLWSRMLYDWFVENGVPAKSQGHADYQDTWPIILDADDVVRDQAVIEKFCIAAKLDPKEVMWTWPAKGQEEITKAGMEGFFLSTLMASSGIKKDLHSSSVSIEEEEQKWKEEFGDEIASKMREMTEKAMPDYQYLRTKRLQAELPN